MGDTVRLGAVLTAILVVGAVGGLTYAFFASASPYVTAKQARSQPGFTCNVAGDLIRDSIHNDLAAGELRFELKDTDGEILPVSKPGNFDSAPRVSVLGSYSGDAFHADRILVKCPSKYESKGKSYVRTRA